MEQFELGGILKLIQFQPLCHEQGLLPQDEAAQGPDQPLQQEWGSHNLATALHNAQFIFNREILVS